MFYQFLGCAVFSVLFVAVIGFSRAMKEDKPQAELPPGVPVDQAGADGGMDYGEREKVERSYCCFAPVEQGLMRPGTRLDPPEYGDFCTACGRACEVGTFLRDPWDGMLTEVETGEKHEEKEGRPWLDFGGPDPDAAYDAWKDEQMERRGR